MNSQNPNHEHLGRTLRDDIMHGDLWRSLRLDVRELNEFYIDGERKKLLERMGWFKRSLFMVWWFLKILLLRLSPARRVLLVIGMFLIVTSGHIQWRLADFYSAPETYIIGGIIIIFVLMLELKDKLLARSELQAGRSVQYALMPPKRPEVPGWDIWLHSEPANDVGGDLVDYIRFDQCRHALALGDVAGKGLRAALIMAKLQASIRALVPGNGTLETLMSRLNAIFIRDSLRSIFASLVYMEFDETDTTLKAVNAGHLPMLLVKSGAAVVEPVGKTGPALGIVSDAVYNETDIPLQQGDTLVVYSDGLTEARNRFGDFFGENRLMRCVQEYAHFPSQQMGQKLLADIITFRGDARIYDDISLIIIKRI
jgi:phosphoserine phosphatase RsbU/P